MTLELSHVRVDPQCMEGIAPDPASTLAWAAVWWSLGPHASVRESVSRGSDGSPEWRLTGRHRGHHHAPMDDPHILGLTLLGAICRHATLVKDHGKDVADDEWLRQRQAIESLWHDIRRLVDELVALAEVDH